MLHHSHFDCNYGGIQVTLDKWFGTFAATKEDVGRCGTENKIKVRNTAKQNICSFFQIRPSAPMLPLVRTPITVSLALFSSPLVKALDDIM
jgi:hypothetical protein